MHVAESTYINAITSTLAGAMRTDNTSANALLDVRARSGFSA